MRKFSIAITIVLLIVVTYSVPALMIDNGGEDIAVSYYTDGKCTANSTYMFDNIYLSNYDYSETDKAERTLYNIVGVSYTLDGDYDKFCEILDDLGIATLATEVVDNIHIIYGRSELCGQPKIVDGLAVNIQLAIRDGVITVGTPLIMGSY